jgi:hypothetical protein
MRYLRLIAFLLAPASVVGCAGGVPAPVGAPIADPAVVVGEVTRSTTPTAPQRAAFGWTLDESGTRVRGRGVARYQAPDRLRLDLFGPRGETYLAAALVGDSFRIPPGASAQVPLPSPALLWGALGVVAPPAGATLVSATEADESLMLRYETGDGQLFQFRVTRGADRHRLRSVERLGRTGVLESVQLAYGTSGALEQARYRDWAAVRDLILNVESITDVASFPSDIWNPTGAAR